MLELPRLDEEQRRRARRMDGEPRDTRVDVTRVTTLAAMGVAAVRAQASDALHAA